MRSLVTGGGGFLGGEIVRLLAEAGDEITVVGRQRYPEAERHGAICHPINLLDRTSLVRVCQNQDRVFHVAARVGVWGPWKEFYETNVIGTENVIGACRAARVPKLIFTSSPSVTFNGADQRDLDETAPYPAHWLSPYPHTKKLAEEEVLAANGPDLSTVALRPHLIWGRGDRFLFPRAIAQARAGKLWRVGNGANLCDLTHVRDAARAHLQAAEALSPASSVAGRAYFINSGKPVVLWDFIGEVLRRAKAPAPRRSLPFAAAFALGAILEKTHRKTEPPMTRFLAHQLAKDHYYSTAAAQSDFGYRPEVTVSRGLDEFFS